MSRYQAEMSRFAGTRDGTNRGGHGGFPLKGEPTPPVPVVPAKCPDELSPPRAHLHEFRGQQRTLGEIAAMVGLKHITLYQRMKRKGMTAAEAAAFPARKWGSK